MIATRLHAPRLSSSTANRQSVASIHNISHQRRRTSKRPSEPLQTIDSDHHEDDDDENDLHEASKVEYTPYIFLSRIP